MYTLLREATLPFPFCASLLSKGQLLKERICSIRSKFFPLTVDPILELLCLPGRQSECHYSCFPWKNGVKVWPYTVTFFFQVKEAALQVLDELHKRLGDDYMPLLPDTVPFLAELMEGKFIHPVRCKLL